MRKHLDKNRKNKIRSSVSSSLRAAFTALRGTSDASSSCLPTGTTSLRRPRLLLVTPLSVMNVSISLGEPDKECDPNVSVRRIGASFRKGGQFPFGNPLTVATDPFKDAEVFHVRGLYIDLPGKF